MTGIVDTFFVGRVMKYLTSHHKVLVSSYCVIYPREKPGRYILQTFRLKSCIMEKDDKPETTKSGRH